MPGPDPRQDDAARSQSTPGAQNRRFRLPKFFTEADQDDSAQSAPNEAPRRGLLASAEALGARVSSGDEYGSAREAALRGAVEDRGHREEASTAGGPWRATAHEAESAVQSEDLNEVIRELGDMRSEVDDMSRTLQELNERGLTQDKIFDTLHSELQDYKNDFIYEHLKPVVRPLLFLFDSIEQFDIELAGYEIEANQERRGGITPTVVRENIIFFREQLVESLRICEVTPMQRPEGLFDSRLHKAIEAVEVDPDQDNIIQQVVRSGWYLNGRVFRPAEVVIGKSREGLDTQLWNKGKTA